MDTLLFLHKVTDLTQFCGNVYRLSIKMLRLIVTVASSLELLYTDTPDSNVMRLIKD